MNKFGIAIVVACLMALTAGTVSADIYTDTYNPSDVALSATNPQYASSISFTHSIQDNGFPHPNEYVIGAMLAITLYDDNDSAYEWVAVELDGTNWQSWEVDGSYSNRDTFSAGVTASLLSDGLLNVVVTATSGDFWFDKSKLTVKTAYEENPVVPVPGAVLLGVLGLGAAGMRLRKNKVA